ncbi:hypothetical protein MTP99_019551 [Tenebrio molitor]|jgi:hypothetical protein|nr:hypothetical protein MTP99_019551 [Tenebrio molitor]
MTEIFIDFQGFYASSGFIFKELAIIFNDNVSEPKHVVFKEPYEFSNLHSRDRVTAKWVTKNYHGLEWTGGDTPYDRLTEILTQSIGAAGIVIVKGLSKERILSQFTSNKTFILNLEEYGCVNFRKLLSMRSDMCDLHSDKSHICALQNANNMSRWYNEHHGVRTVPEQGSELDDGYDTCGCFC